MTDDSVKECLRLSDKEARVLGALMEKQYTTPEAYPLTLNSLVSACNQKSSREPVTQFSNADVQQTLNQLRDRRLVEQEFGSRADRYNQKLAAQLFLDRPQQALLTIMLLRGSQTVGDLYIRTQRMTEFSCAADIESLLETLCQKVTPIMVRIGRQSGQREDRYMHLLCGDVDMTKISANAVSKKSTAGSSSTAELTERVTILEAQVARLIEAAGLENE